MRSLLFRSALLTPFVVLLTSAAPTPPSLDLELVKRWDTDECTAAPLFPEFFPSQNLSVPEGQRTVAVVVGIGNQTYTCASAGATPTRTATAVLYDVHRALLSAPDPGVAKYQIVSHGYIFRAPNPAYNLSSADFAGTHAYQPDERPTPDGSCPTTPPALIPFFRLERTTCPSDPHGPHDLLAFPVAFASSPLSPPGANVDWAQLRVVGPGVEGTERVAKTIFRTDTQGGGQPRECTFAGQVDNVPYAALYWFLR
ncbi:hypothetical protein JCM8097_005365 [Rhodosporidiobolus ruineniae]